MLIVTALIIGSVPPSTHTRGAGFKLHIIISNGFQETDALFFSIRNFGGVWTSAMEIHRFVAFYSSSRFLKAGTTAFYLDSTTGLGLNVLHISTLLTHDFGTKIKPMNWFKIDWYIFVWPFFLKNIRVSTKGLNRQAMKDKHILCLTHPVQLPAEARDGGIVVRRQG